MQPAGGKVDGYLLGLVGAIGSGGSATAELLAATGRWRPWSLATVLAEEARRRGLPFATRRDRQNAGDVVRQAEGPAYLAEQALPRLPPEQDLVLTGIRNPAELTCLRKARPGFRALAIDAPVEARWQRVTTAYDGDRQAFEADDRRDREDEARPWGQQVAQCVRLADGILQNREDWSGPEARSGYLARATALLEDIRSLRRSPTEAEQWMAMAYREASRSSCLSRQVGAVLTDATGRVLARGFNEVPAGALPCAERFGYCYRKRRKQREFAELELRCCPRCGARRSPGDPPLCPDCGVDLLAALMPGKDLDYTRSVHAEEAALLSLAGREGLPGSTCTTTTFPCFLCAKKLAAAGVTRVIYVEPYPIPETVELFEDVGVEVVPFEGILRAAFQRERGEADPTPEESARACKVTGEPAPGH